MEVNLLEVVVAAFAAVALGFLWYGPLFGKQWMKLSGMTEAKMKEAKTKGMTTSYLMMMVSALVMAYVLAVFANYAQVGDYMSGALLGFWGWLGFVAPVQMSKVLWGSDSYNLYYLETGYYLASLLIMGALIGGWV